jgi:hypothetical protein
MKRLSFLIHRITLAIFIAATLCTVSASAQTVIPILECVEPAETGRLRAFIGYKNTFNLWRQTYLPGTSANYFSPVPVDRGQPSDFYRGEHRAAFSATFNPATTPVLTYTLGGNSITITAESPRCHTGTITYQGRLPAGGGPQTRNYDLQFQLFDAATGGSAESSLVSIPNVAVTNGAFTVPLDFGLSAITTPAQRFVETGFRRMGSSDAFTTVEQRQPLTVAPYAAFAGSAFNASEAKFAQTAWNASLLGGFHSGDFVRNTTEQQWNTNINIGGNGTIGGILTANTVSASSAGNNVITAQSSSNIGTWLNLNNTSPGGGSWSIISAGSGNGEGAGNLLFYKGGTRMILSPSGLHVNGTLTANAKNFQIDHPLDPANKVLNYTSVESPDMKNIYDGNATTDGKGEAIVTMPSYFEALNKDFRYQLTVIGQFAQAIVAEEITRNTFKIRTDKPNVKVSWQVTGVRHDKFAEDKRPPVEQNKLAADKGKCLYAPACGNER